MSIGGGPHWSRPLWFTALVAHSQREVIL